MTHFALRALVAAAVLALVGCQKEAPAPTSVAAPQPLPAAPMPSAPPPVPAASKISTAEQIVAPPLELSDAVGAVAKGKQLFADKGCTTCHTSIGGAKALGPELKGVTVRRSLVYIERMMLRPDVMIRTDPTAKQLFAQFAVPMTNQRIDPEKELPFLVDYLKSLEK